MNAIPPGRDGRSCLRVGTHIRPQRQCASLGRGMPVKGGSCTRLINCFADAVAWIIVIRFEPEGEPSHLVGPAFATTEVSAVIAHCCLHPSARQHAYKSSADCARLATTTPAEKVRVLNARSRETSPASARIQVPTSSATLFLGAKNAEFA